MKHQTSLAVHIAYIVKNVVDVVNTNNRLFIDYSFGLLEDFDHLYRYANLLELLEGKKAEAIVQGLTDVLPGAITHDGEPARTGGRGRGRTRVRRAGRRAAR